MCQSTMRMKLKTMKEKERFGAHKSNTCGKPIGSRPYDCEPELDDVLIMPLKYQCKPEGGKTLDAEKKWKHWRYYS